MNTEKVLISLLLLYNVSLFSSEKDSDNKHKYPPFFEEMLSKVPAPILKDHTRVCCKPEEREKIKEQFEREYLEQAIAYARNIDAYMEENGYKRSQGRNMPRRLESRINYYDMDGYGTFNITSLEYDRSKIVDALFGDNKDKSGK